MTEALRKGEFLIGTAGQVRPAQVMMNFFEPPEHPEGQPVEEYLSTTFLSELRKCSKEHGCTSNNDGDTYSGLFLIGYRGKLFTVEGDFTLCEVKETYNAIGSGEEFALGAMYATQNSGLSPEERIRIALEAAGALCSTAWGPHYIEKLEPAPEVAA